MPNTETTKIPAPLYAAAGAGEIAIERLRKLPEKVAAFQERMNTLSEELPGRVNTLQEKVTAKVAEVPSLVAELRQRFVDADTDKLRESAKRNGQTLRTQAQAAQERAAAIYADLVARGEVVVGRSMPVPRDESPIHADVIEPAKVETLEAEAPKAEFVKKPAARARKNDTTKNDTTKGDAK
jgi:hypothetical protein